MSKIAIIFYLLLGSIFVQNVNAQNAVGPCEFSPGTLTVLGIGSTWATIGWDSTQAGLTYEVRIYDSSGYSIADTINDNFYTFNNLVPGSNYKIEVTVLCSEWQRSSNVSEIEILTIITDLALEFNDQIVPSDNPICEKLVSNHHPIPVYTCQFSSEIGDMFLLEFIRFENMKMIKLGIKRIGSHEFLVGKMPKDYYNGDLDGDLVILSDKGLEVDSITSRFYVKCNKNENSQIELGNFSIISLGGNNYNLEFRLGNVIPLTYTYLIYLFSDDNDNSIAHRNTNLNFSSPSILPNPTTTTLQIQIPTTFTTQVQGTLLNLSGAVVQRYGLEAGVNTVPTTNLSPGIYFLRLEGPGYAETFKVVKVE
jgi:hypothetical protein